LTARLQSVLHAAARLIYSKRKYEHITLLLMELHWLSVPERIQFKLVVLVFRCLHGTTPPYFDDQLQPVAALESHRRLRSSASALGQTGHPEGATDYHRRPCILCRRSSRLEQFVVIDVECTFVVCFRRMLKCELFHRCYDFVLTDRPTLF